MKKSKPNPDDPGQSKRFKEVAGKRGVDLDEAKLTEALRRVSGHNPKKKKKPAEEYRQDNHRCRAMQTRENHMSKRKTAPAAERGGASAFDIDELLAMNQR